MTTNHPPAPCVGGSPQTVDARSVKEEAAKQLKEIEATVAKCADDLRRPDDVPPENWHVSDEPCELCVERLKDAAVIRSLLAAMTESAPKEQKPGLVRRYHADARECIAEAVKTMEAAAALLVAIEQETLDLEQGSLDSATHKDTDTSAVLAAVNRWCEHAAERPTPTPAEIGEIVVMVGEVRHLRRRAEAPVSQPAEEK